MDIPKSDVDFVKNILLPWSGVKAVRLFWSDSRKKWPDIWVQRGAIPIITLTAEWRSHDVHLRRSQLVHEFLHLQGLEHNDMIGYSTYPEKDFYSKKIYRELIKYE